MKMRPPLLLATLFGALAPLIAVTLAALRDKQLARTGASAFDWPEWSVGSSYVIDSLEACSMVSFCAAAWMFERFMRGSPPARVFWLVWFPLLFSGLALVNMGTLHTGFAAIIGFALMANAYDWKRDRRFARKHRRPEVTGHNCR